jgi:hypothetical protein
MLRLVAISSTVTSVLRNCRSSGCNSRCEIGQCSATVSISAAPVLPPRPNASFRFFGERRPMARALMWVARRSAAIRGREKWGCISSDIAP